MSYLQSPTKYWIDQIIPPPRYSSTDGNAMVGIMRQSNQRKGIEHLVTMLDDMQKRIIQLESEREHFKTEVVKNTQVKITDQVLPFAKNLKKELDKTFKGE